MTQKLFIIGGIIMLRTTDGRTMSMIVKELGTMKPFYDNLSGTKMEFTIDS